MTGRVLLCCDTATPVESVALVCGETVLAEHSELHLKGHGATAKLVFLPAEAHGYRARESVGHTLYETAAWLDTYVKNRQ